MSPLERHNAVAKAMGLPTASRPAGITFGPEGHPHTVVPDAEAGTIGNNPAPPSPAALEAANKPQAAPSASRQAELDADLQARGLQKRPDGRVIADGEIDREAIDALTTTYRALVGPLVGKTDAASLATAARFKAAYEKDVKSILEGKQLTAKQIATLKGSLGKVDSFVPKTKETAPVQNTATVEQWEAAHKTVANEHGMVRVESFNVSALSGYTLPKLADGWGYPVSTIRQLADARQSGVTQKQLNDFIRAQAVRDGWVKA